MLETDISHDEITRVSRVCEVFTARREQRRVKYSDTDTEMFKSNLVQNTTIKKNYSAIHDLIENPFSKFCRLLSIAFDIDFKDFYRQKFDLLIGRLWEGLVLPPNHARAWYLR